MIFFCSLLMVIFVFKSFKIFYRKDLYVYFKGWLLLRDKERQRGGSPAGSLPKWPHQQELGCSKTKIQEFVPGLPHGCLSLRISFSIFLVHKQGARLELE